MKNLEHYIAFDLEFNTVDDIAHLIQVSAVEIRDGKMQSSFDSYVHSTVPLASFIVGLTGITQEKVLQAPKAEAVMADFKAFVGSLPVIGYNAIKSDLPILLENGLDLSAQYALDVYEEADKLRDNKLHGIKNFKLHSLAEFFEVAKKNAHNALADAQMTADVYEALKAMMAAEDYNKEAAHLDNPFASLSASFDEFG